MNLKNRKCVIMSIDIYYLNINYAIANPNLLK